jgi:hypothetical protein
VTRGVERDSQELYRVGPGSIHGQPQGVVGRFTSLFDLETSAAQPGDLGNTDLRLRKTGTESYEKLGHGEQIGGVNGDARAAELTLRLVDRKIDEKLWGATAWKTTGAKRRSYQEAHDDDEIRS